MLRNFSYSACLTAALLAATSNGCREPQSSAHDRTAETKVYEPFAGEYPIKIVCTIGQIADMLRNVGGEHVAVTGLMGPGVDPHLYRELPADIEKLSSADAIFYNGLHLEGRMADLFARLAQRRPTFAVTQGLEESHDSRLRTPPEFAGYHDPHVWHDPKLWAECVQYATDRLCDLDPAHRDDYQRNSAAYQADLHELDQYCRERLAEIPESQRVLVTAHDAFGYFCLTYGLESMPLKGVSTEDEVTLGRMDEVIEFIVERNVKAVFVESAVAPRIVEALIKPCQQRGHEVHVGGELYADALGPADTGEDTYVGMLRANVDTIVSALNQ
jgi:manganese/zinc/iron transport system substrate-binding protein